MNQQRLRALERKMKKNRATTLSAEDHSIPIETIDLIIQAAGIELTYTEFHKERISQIPNIQTHTHTHTDQHKHCTHMQKKTKYNSCAGCENVRIKIELHNH